MRFLEQFFKPVVPTEDRDVSSLREQPLPTIQLPEVKPPSPSPWKDPEPDPVAVEKIKDIEPQALNLGWLPEQLWRFSYRPDLKGLVWLMTPEQVIGEVTARYIELCWKNAFGREQRQCFFNHRVEQPWVKRIVPRRSLNNPDYLSHYLN